MSRPTGSSKLDALRDRIRHLEQPARHGVLPFGVAAIDRALPGGGLALGADHEILGAGGDEEDGAAAAGFAAGILARLGAAGSGGRPVLWCLKQPDLYGPGLRLHGLDPGRLVLVRAARDDALLWAVEEGLRTPGLAAVVGEIGRLPMVAGRRLQLAAERSGVTALLLRRWRTAAEAAAERDQPSAVLTRWRVSALPSASLFFPPLSKNPLPLNGGKGRKNYGEEKGWGVRIAHGSSPWAEGSRPRWQVELLRVRGGAPCAWDVEVADATGHVSLSAELADRPAAPVEQRPGKHGAEPSTLLRRAG